MAYASGVVAVATTNVNKTTPGFSSLDGVALTSGMRILLTAQTTQSQNGVWIFNGSLSALSRPATGDPFHSGQQLDYEIVVPVGSIAGANSVWGGSEWWMSSPTSGTATVDTTAITFIRRNARPVQARLAASGNVNISSPGLYIDYRLVTDGVMNTGASSTTLTCNTSKPFTSADIGKTITVFGALSGGGNLITTIAGFTSGSVVTLTLGCTMSVTGATVQWGATLNVGDVVLLAGQTTPSAPAPGTWKTFGAIAP